MSSRAIFARSKSHEEAQAARASGVTHPQRRGGLGRFASGVTHPKRRGGLGRFLTDVLVELGFTDHARVQRAIEEVRSRGISPERLLLEERAITSEQLSHAIAERYGLDHLDLGIFKVDMAAANLLSASAAKRYGAVPVAFSTITRCWWRCRTPPTCSRSTTSRC